MMRRHMRTETPSIEDEEFPNYGLNELDRAVKHIHYG